ncbi:T9SS type A sorting domain-containing protein [Rhodocaloribacter litoris]|uniref:T9SS type A sorting domain-containing protein n=1 Tax=Rhodocaloribacter litoris TaxID=2558931 RepID=UPI001422D662|nr:T9SS type A sorting domain-containing protein [Rhodocaloribacter litoris]QXD15532.1 T9SS type A sorting domain-containing protein [Rhodocaloribacter litoris]
MKRFLPALTIVLVLGPGFCPGQVTKAQNTPEWLHQAWAIDQDGFGGVVRPYGISAALPGVAYVAGGINAISYFDTFTLSPDSSGSFIAGYDPTGNLQWARTGTTFPDRPCAFHVAAGTDGAIYTSEGYHFAFDTNMWTEGGVVLSKYASDGTLLWSHPMGDSTQVTNPNIAPVYLKGLGIDQEDNLYAAGEFRGSLVLGTDTLTSTDIDVLLLSFDADGNLRWYEHLEGSGFDAMAGIFPWPRGIFAVSPSGNVYLGGFFTAGTVFNAGRPGAYTMETGSWAVAGYDATGTLRWVRTRQDLQVEGNVGLLRAAVDPAENLFLAWFMRDVGGTTTALVGDSLLQDPGFGGAFLTKYDPEGNLDWVQQFRGDGNEFIWALETDTEGRVYVGGSFDALHLELDTTTLSKQELQADELDGFVAGYDPAGHLIWTLHVPGEETQRVYALATDPVGNLYVTGEFEGTLRLGTEVREARGRFDFFVAKYTKSTVLEAETAHPVSETMRLEPNHPNPFTSSTSLHFTLPAASSVTLRIYDVLGREVATLLDGFLPAGHHEVSFTAERLPGGVYFYRLETPAGRQTRGMVLRR